MLGDTFDPRVKNTYLLLFGTIVYLIAISFFIIFLNKSHINGIEILFALTLLPLLIIFVMVWGYGIKFKMQGLELDLYPVEKLMKAPATIPDTMTGKDAETKMKDEKIDLLHILDKNGILQGILTGTDILNARRDNKLLSNVTKLMTKRENIIHASEREDIKSIMKKIGESKHSRLPVLDRDNKVMGIIDSVDINDLLSRIS